MLDLMADIIGVVRGEIPAPAAAAEPSMDLLRLSGWNGTPPSMHWRRLVKKVGGCEE